MDNFVRVTEKDALNEILERSKQEPVVLFKHSTTCPISASAYREMSGFDGKVILIEVQRARELSNEIENRTGLRHESPQVLVLKNGQVVWDASHFSVKANAVADAVKEHGI